MKKKNNSNDILNENSLKGLEDKFKKIFKIDKKNLETNEKFNKYKKRLNHELKIINEMKYASYFLIVSDYIKWAKKFIIIYKQKIKKHRCVPFL